MTTTMTKPFDDDPLAPLAASKAPPLDVTEIRAEMWAIADLLEKAHDEALGRLRALRQTLGLHVSEARYRLALVGDIPMTWPVAAILLAVEPATETLAAGAVLCDLREVAGATQGRFFAEFEQRALTEYLKAHPEEAEDLQPASIGGAFACAIGQGVNRV